MKYRFLLMFAALVWGGAFVAQRMSTETMGAYSFNGIRFFMGALSVLPLVFVLTPSSVRREIPPRRLSLVAVACITGFVLFAGNAVQQIGLFYTTAGKAGFITALYIVAVPLLGLIFYNPLRLSHLSGCIIAVTGLYFLAFHDDMAMNIGDLLELSGVIFWASHILLVSYFVRFYEGVRIAVGQFFVCSALNMLVVLLLPEPLDWSMIMQTALPLLYGGLCSCGIAYTLQIIGQQYVPPTEASLLLSFEMIFSALAGYLFLGETMTGREIFGCLLMTVGIFSAQIPSRIIWQRLRPAKKDLHVT